MWSFQWFSVNILRFVCSKALTLPAEVWWLAKPFVPAEAPLVRHRAAHAASAAGEDETPERSAAKPRDCVHFLCLIIAFFLFYTCSRAHACMMFTAYFGFFSFFLFFFNTYGFLRLCKVSRFPPQMRSSTVSHIERLKMQCIWETYFFD